MAQFMHVREFISGMGLAFQLIIIIAIIAFFGAAIIYGPFITIWAINTLFGFTIAYTFKTWLAMIVMHNLLGGGAKLADLFSKKKVA